MDLQKKILKGKEEFKLNFGSYPIRCELSFEDGKFIKSFSQIGNELGVNFFGLDVFLGVDSVLTDGTNYLKI